MANKKTYLSKNRDFPCAHACTLAQYTPTSQVHRPSQASNEWTGPRKLCVMGPCGRAREANRVVGSGSACPGTLQRHRLFGSSSSVVQVSVCASAVYESIGPCIWCTSIDGTNSRRWHHGQLIAHLMPRVEPYCTEVVSQQSAYSTVSPTQYALHRVQATILTLWPLPLCSLPA